MAVVNTDAVLRKVQAYTETPAGKKKVQNFIKQAKVAHIRLSSGQVIHTPEEAAGKFIEVLHNSIDSSGLSSGAISAVSDIEHGAAQSIGENKWVIDVYFKGDLSRPSLDDERYDGIDDIVALFNNGVDHRMHPVHGDWHGKETWSKTVIPGSHFIEQAIRDFMGNYATEYNVIDISVQGL